MVAGAIDDKGIECRIAVGSFGVQHGFNLVVAGLELAAVDHLWSHCHSAQRQH